MWIMTTIGAFSVTRRHKCPPGDPRTLHVRARRREWLVTLREKYAPDLSEPIHYPNADYQWRAYIEPEQWALAMATIGLHADRYENFKNATLDPRFSPYPIEDRHTLHTAYARCWTALLDAGDGTSIYDLPLKPRPRRTGTGKGTAAAC